MIMIYMIYMIYMSYMIMLGSSDHVLAVTQQSIEKPSNTHVFVLLFEIKQRQNKSCCDQPFKI